MVVLNGEEQKNKMRIIAGKYKGRKLQAPKGKDIRPTSDRLKESLFGALGDALEDMEVLDLFGGTGNLGLEALSRGAKKVVFVDRDRTALLTIRKNCTLLGLGKEEFLILPGLAEKISKKYEEKLQGYSFGVFLIDPPYYLYEKEDFLPSLAEALLALPRGEEPLWIFEHPVSATFPSTWDLWKSREVGQKGWSVFFKLS